MIYYPLLAGVRDVLVITAASDAAAFGRLPRDGSHFGISITYAVQPTPDGLARVCNRQGPHRDDRVGLILEDLRRNAATASHAFGV
jgi:glucose-1-phosphate thymidylyltransferase